MRVSVAVLRLLQAANTIYGLGILVLLVVSFADPVGLFGALGFRELFQSETQRLGARLIMLLGLGGALATRIALTRLAEIVDTVRRGDPFLAENAIRLKSIAWAAFALAMLQLTVKLVGVGFTTAMLSLGIRTNVSVALWLSVLLLFILARVFEIGAAMRSDLQGTV